jgi:hypothetical protein
MRCVACKLTVVEPPEMRHCPRCRQPLIANTLPTVEVTEADRKMAICRSNVCGYYDAEHDACGILWDRGKAGAVTYLLTHPETKCVAPEPLF